MFNYNIIALIIYMVGGLVFVNHRVKMSRKKKVRQ